MATLADLEATNPDIRRQLREWREVCAETGEDASDYQAFRQHVIFHGAPDPGEEPFADFWPVGGAATGRPASGRGATMESDEADASPVARPVSDAEASQLGSLGGFAAGLLGRFRPRCLQPGAPGRRPRRRGAARGRLRAGR
jgi:hypothetical protein